LKVDFNMTLDALGLDEDAQISQVTGAGPFRRRLLELGLLPGTAIRRTGQAPLGDPLQFQVRGAVLCIRRSEAATVRIERS
jgi:ferrous iron transport protein A